MLAYQARSWDRDRVATNLNSTAAALLGLLHEGPMTGGELVAAAKERMEPFWSVTRSQVYRELPGLAAAGYVRPGKLGPRAAQPYTITRWCCGSASARTTRPARSALWSPTPAPGTRSSWPPTAPASLS